MTNQSDKNIPGYIVSLREGAVAGTFGWGMASCLEIAGGWLGRQVVPLSPQNAGWYSGFVTVMHTLLKEDFEFIKKKLPKPLQYRAVHWIVDATISTSIIAGFALSTYKICSWMDPAWTPEDALTLGCLSEAANLATHQGLWALYKLSIKILKSQL